MVKISVLVPTFRRPQHLLLCLRALQEQTLAPLEVLVVRQECDDMTGRCLATDCISSLPIREVIVSCPGQIAALNAGLDAARGDIVAITDDDARPRPDWLCRISMHFAQNPQVGGVGGRDWVPQEPSGESREHPVVGRVQWFGRVIGNHHLGCGGAREVDILKGANMSFRMAAIQGLRFDARLRGSGAQVHNDMAFSLGIRRAGWKLVYDPAVAVQHAAAERPDGARTLNLEAQRDAVHNETLTLLEYLPPLRRAAFVIFALLIGTRAAPGAAGLLGGRSCGSAWPATISGRLTGWRAYCRAKRDGEGAG